MRDAKLAVETGVDGLDVVIGTSSFLREHSHGKDMAYIEKTAIEVIEYIKSKGLEVRCESIPHLPPGQRPISTPVVVWATSRGLRDIPLSFHADNLQSPARTPSGPIWSTSYLSTGRLTRSALTVSVSPIPSAALPPDRSTTYVLPGDLLKLCMLTRFAARPDTEGHCLYVCRISCYGLSLTRPACDIETHFHDDTGCSIANAYVT